ncbi:MAG TPA: MFS transporter [Myxococcota bacterium]|nr:MFS transporter [Myxococcota bacterium]
MPKLSLFTKISYGIGQLGEGIKNGSFEIFLLFYYNQVLGLPGTLAGAATFIALGFDAFFDPFVGSLSDSLRSRWGRRHPFMYAGAVPFGVMFYLLWVPPSGLGELGLFLWLTAFAIGVRAAMAIYLIPHNAMGAELSSDYHERTSIGGWRIVLGFVGAFLASLLGFGVFFKDTPDHPFGQRNLAAYPHFAEFFGVLATAAVLWSAFGTQSRIPFLPVPARDQEPLTFTRFGRELRDSLRSPSFRALFVGTLVFFVTRGVQTALQLHLSVHFWELGSQEILKVNVIGFAGLLVGVPAWGALSRRFDKKPSFLAGVAIFSVAIVAGPVLKLADLWPAHENELAYLGLLGMFGFFANFGGAAALIAATSMMADLTDEHEFETGLRQEGIFFGAVAFSAKASSGLGHLLSGVALDAIGFQVNAERGAVAPEVVRHLAVIYGPATIGVLLIGAFYLARYQLTRDRLSEIQKVLEQRRTAISS